MLHSVSFVYIFLIPQRMGGGTRKHTSIVKIKVAIKYQQEKVEISVGLRLLILYYFILVFPCFFPLCCYTEFIQFSQNSLELPYISNILNSLLRNIINTRVCTIHIFLTNIDIAMPHLFRMFYGKKCNIGDTVPPPPFLASLTRHNFCPEVVCIPPIHILKFVTHVYTHSTWSCFVCF